MVKIAICDDEQIIRDYLYTLTKEQNFESEIKAYASAAEYLSDHDSFDILLLDIEMNAESSDLDGMELAKVIRNKQEKQPIIIFVTGYENYVYNAFDVGAFQYLLKPINEKKFAEVMERAVRQILSEQNRQKKTLEIQYAGTKKIVPLNDILYVEIQNHKVILHTKDRNLSYYAKIGDLEKELQGSFFRIHKGYLVNLSCVDEYNKVEVTLSNGEILFVSKHKKYFALFLTCVYFCFDRSIGLMGNSILYMLNTKFACCEKLEIALRNTACNYVSAYAFEVFLLVLLVYLISHKILIAPLYLNFREWSCLCMIPLIGIVFGEIVDRLLFVVKDHVAFGIYDEYPAFLAVIPLIAILFCIGIFLTVISYQEMVKLQEEKGKYFVQEQQVRAMQERIREVEQFYTGIRKMRHEMRNHLTNIKGLVRNENYTAIEKYISEMDESMSLFDVSIKTGNPVLDVIVNDKKKSAESSGIRFESDFCFPASDCFHAYDIGIIVNNLLVNAMEACEKMKGEDENTCRFHDPKVVKRLFFYTR